MAWIYNGRKYWYHNGKRYSRPIKRKRIGYFIKLPGYRWEQVSYTKYYTLKCGEGDSRAGYRTKFYSRELLPSEEEYF